MLNLQGNTDVWNWEKFGTAKRIIIEYGCINRINKILDLNVSFYTDYDLITPVNSHLPVTNYPV